MLILYITLRYLRKVTKPKLSQLSSGHFDPTVHPRVNVLKLHSISQELMSSVDNERYRTVVLFQQGGISLKTISYLHIIFIGRANLNILRCIVTPLILEHYCKEGKIT